MMKYSSVVVVFLIILYSLMHTSCKKDKMLSTGGQLTFSVDTLSFDTVFTSLGSFTAEFKIYNPQDQKITISGVRLENTSGPFFHMNVDGVPGDEVKNIEIAAKDSIYVFATVKIDPTIADNPFIIDGKITATLNGKDFSVPLMAYGQNAHYIVDSVLDTQTWLTDKPYVIIHSAQVEKDNTLTIPSGCRIYMHADSRLLVDGTLKAIGTKKDSIIFQGDRLDRKYFGNEGYPGEWGGLYFTPISTANQLEYVILKNCGSSTGNGSPFAIEVAIDSVADAVPQLIMRHTIIENSIGYGLLCFTANVVAENCLFNTCGAQALATFQGGKYEFDNCTFVNYGTNKVNHTDNPTAIILNYFKIDDDTYNLGDLQATLRNCIIWGSLDNELGVDKIDGVQYKLTLDHCMVKAKDAIPAYVTNIAPQTTDPKFVDYNTWDYHLQQGSPAIGNGVAIPNISDDLDGNPRAGSNDIGCFQHK